MHRWDAEASQGMPGPVDAALAVAGVHEVAEMFFPRQVELGRIPPLAPVLRLAPDEGPPVVFAGDVTGTISGVDGGGAPRLSDSGSGLSVADVQY